MGAAARPLGVTVVGGGFAAAELLLALRALAEDRVRVELITPDRRLAMRVEAPGDTFGASTVTTYDLARLAGDAGATIRRGTVRAVEPQRNRVLLSSGATASYDVLVVATGARAPAAVAGATTFRDHRDAQHVRRIVAAVEAAEVGSVAFAVPSGVSWTLPIYELALLTAAATSGSGARVTVVTPERRALEVFGREVSDAVERLLADREIGMVRAALPAAVGRGRLELMAGPPVPADRVVAVPRLVGRTRPGLPANWSGFVTTDEHGAVAGLADVYAAGDITDFPVKQGGVAAQQAEVIARAIASRAGASVDQESGPYVLRTRLTGAGRPLYLRATLDTAGRPRPSAGDGVSETPPWWPDAKLFGRHLTPWMAGAPAAA